MYYHAACGLWPEIGAERTEERAASAQANDHSVAEQVVLTYRTCMRRAPINFVSSGASKSIENSLQDITRHVDIPEMKHGRSDH
jgi:hypothetical protein